jgi:hypothetical protein
MPLMFEFGVGGRAGPPSVLISSSSDVILCSRSSLSIDLGVASIGLGRFVGLSVVSSGVGSIDCLRNFSGLIFSQDALRLEFFLGVGARSS